MVFFFPVAFGGGKLEDSVEDRGCLGNGRSHSLIMSSKPPLINPESACSIGIIIGNTGLESGGLERTEWADLGTGGDDPMSAWLSSGVYAVYGDCATESVGERASCAEGPGMPESDIMGLEGPSKSAIEDLLKCDRPACLFREFDACPGTGVGARGISCR